MTMFTRIGRVFGALTIFATSEGDAIGQSLSSSLPFGNLKAL